MQLKVVTSFRSVRLCVFVFGWEVYRYARKVIALFNFTLEFNSLRYSLLITRSGAAAWFWMSTHLRDLGEAFTQWLMPVEWTLNKTRGEYTWTPDENTFMKQWLEDSWHAFTTQLHFNSFLSRKSSQYPPAPYHSPSPANRLAAMYTYKAHKSVEKTMLLATQHT